MSTNRLRFKLRNGQLEELNTDHYHLILVRESLFEDVEWLRIWRCFHGGMVISSHNVDGYDLLEVLDKPDHESVVAALKVCLPKADEWFAANVLAGLATESLAVPVPKPRSGEGPPSELIEKLTTVIHDALQTSLNLRMFTENPILETPDDQGELTIYMSGRGPVVINAAEWVLISEEFIGIEKSVCVCVRIRQHAQRGDLLIYGENRRFDKPRSIFAGELLVGSDCKPASLLPGLTVHRITAELMTDGVDRKLLANRLLAKLPIERI
jgi:hypothetical protein